MSERRLIPKIIVLVAATLAFLAWGIPEGHTEAGKSNPALEEWGNYYALIIGINSYQEWPKLTTAVHDGEVLRDILIRDYGFSPDRVVLRTEKQATRSKIYADLRNMAAALGPEDNLVVYFAGHGQLDDLTGDGYWIPVEGSLKDSSTWLDHSGVKNIFSSDKVKGKNIVLVADSCYAGTLLREGPSMPSLEDARYQERLRELSAKKSRQVITSGGNEPVADLGRDGHSLFAYYLLRALRENDQPVIDLENLFHSRIWKQVSEIGGQRPNVGRLKTPMDEDGQFVLVRISGGTKVAPPSGVTSGASTSTASPAAAKTYQQMRQYDCRLVVAEARAHANRMADYANRAAQREHDIFEDLKSLTEDRIRAESDIFREMLDPRQDWQKRIRLRDSYWRNQSQLNRRLELVVQENNSYMSKLAEESHQHRAAFFTRCLDGGDASSPESHLSLDPGDYSQQSLDKRFKDFLELAKQLDDLAARAGGEDGEPR